MNTVWSSPISASLMANRAWRSGYTANSALRAAYETRLVSARIVRIRVLPRKRSQGSRSPSPRAAALLDDEIVAAVSRGIRAADARHRVDTRRDRRGEPLGCALAGVIDLGDELAIDEQLDREVEVVRRVDRDLERAGALL